MSNVPQGKTNSVALTEGPHRATARSFKVTLLMASLLIASGLSAQTAPVPPAPEALTNAHVLFLSNTTDSNNDIAQESYRDLYAALSQYKRYQISGEPSAADLILVFSLRPDAYGDGPLLQLKALDPKTQIVLWSAGEAAENINTTKSWQAKIITVAADRLANDFDAAVQQRPLTVQKNKKTRF